MKRAIFFLIAALFILLVIDPNLSASLSPESTQIPVYDENQPLRTNNDVDTRRSSSSPLIYINPARGGKDTGYINQNGTSEKDLLMQMALTIGSALENAGYRVEYSRWYDDIPACSSTDECEQTRIDKAKELGADYILELQVNQDNSLHQGYSLFTRPDKPVLNDLAREIAREMERISYSRYEGHDTDHYDSFPILKSDDINAVLLQVGYITNPQDYERMSDTKFQTRIAQAITQAFLDTVD